MKNTKENGVLRFMIFREGKEREYTGICLDLSMVKVNKDPIVLKKDLELAANGYISVVRKNKLPDSLLNQQDNLPQKYLETYELANRLWHHQSIKNSAPQKIKKINTTDFFIRQIQSSINIPQYAQ